VPVSRYFETKHLDESRTDGTAPDPPQVWAPKVVPLGTLHQRLYLFEQGLALIAIVQIRQFWLLEPVQRQDQNGLFLGGGDLIRQRERKR
jgi:hypothetical protein